jgi:hypothetical protein
MLSRERGVRNEMPSLAWAKDFATPGLEGRIEVHESHAKTTIQWFKFFPKLILIGFFLLNYHKDGLFFTFCSLGSLRE